MRSIWCSLLLPMFSGLYVCLSIGHDPTNTDEPIEVPFGVWTLVIPRNHVLGWGGAWVCRGKGLFFRGRTWERPGLLASVYSKYSTLVATGQQRCGLGLPLL